MANSMIVALPFGHFLEARLDEYYQWLSTDASGLRHNETGLTAVY